MSSEISCSAADVANPVSVIDAEKQTVTAKYIADIIRCYNALVSLPHLQPCLTVNKAFSELMIICTKVPEESDVDTVGIFGPVLTFC